MYVYSTYIYIDIIFEFSSSAIKIRTILICNIEKLLLTNTHILKMNKEKTLNSNPLKYFSFNQKHL